MAAWSMSAFFLYQRFLAAMGADWWPHHPDELHAMQLAGNHSFRIGPNLAKIVTLAGTPAGAPQAGPSPCMPLRSGQSIPASPSLSPSPPHYCLGQILPDPAST